MLSLFLSSVISANIDLCGGVPHDRGTENLKLIFRQSELSILKIKESKKIRVFKINIDVFEVKQTDELSKIAKSESDIGKILEPIFKN